MNEYDQGELLKRLEELQEKSNVTAFVLGNVMGKLSLIIESIGAEKDNDIVFAELEGLHIYLTEQVNRLYYERQV